jgi:hypothetical protein
MRTIATKSKPTGSADQVMGMSEPRLQQPVPGGTPLVQRQSEAAAADQDVPGAVNQALNSPGQPLDAATQAFFEPRFGHDFGKVRVYSDDSAAASAKALHAVAYTVAPNIVFGAGRYAPHTDAGQRLLAHELTHVVQQQGARPFIQRQDDEAAECRAPKASAVFVLDNTAVWDPAEKTTALIRGRTQELLSAKEYKVGDWLGDEWEIVEISYQYVVVINATCGTEEKLLFERGELTPDLSVGLNETNFGAGVVKVYDDFKRIVFEPTDRSKPPREYRLETLQKAGQAPLTVYVLQSGDRTLYPPADLEDMLRLHLVGEKRGTPKPKPEIAEETWEDLTTSRP